MKRIPVYLLLLFPMLAGAEVHYVSPVGTHAFPYTNWMTAATNIQVAVDACTAGDSVYVTNGTYLLPSEIVVDQAIHIQSVHGSAVTILDGRGAGRCLNLTSSACVVSGFTIAHGYHETAGGGIYCEDETPVVSNCVVRYNQAAGPMYSGDGGGMYGGTAVNCVFSNNTASARGGALCNSVVVNGLVARNHAHSVEAYGGGICSCQAFSCTIAGNWSFGEGGGVADSTLYNCIVTDNDVDYEGYHEISASVAYYSCVPSLVAGVNGNITNAPLFVDASQLNYRLLPESPCMDAGGDAYVTNTLDLDGLPRIMGGKVDMGAYETVPTVHFVSRFGAHLFPFDTWATAATNIQAAVDACVDGHAVYVTNGVYNLTSEIWVDAEIRIESINGPEATVIDGNHAVRCLNLGTNASVISGLTVRGGYGGSGYGSGIHCENTVPVATNCILKSNWDGAMRRGTALNCVFRANQSDVGGGMYGGIAESCTFIENEASSGGALYDVYAVDCTMITNQAAEGGGAFGGSLTNCTFVGNRAQEGGGMYGGVASNCVFEQNRALYGGAVAYGDAIECRMENNRTYGATGHGYTGGGGAYESALTNCEIRNNYAYWDGGGLLGGTAVGCIIEDNTASQSGGGGYGITAVNCLIVGNFSDLHGDGSGLAYSDAYNCTIVGNHSAYLNGVAMLGSARNCIIYYNTNDDETPADSGAMLFNTCCPAATPGVNGNITNPPLFGDGYHLQSDSPCINWGNNAYVSEPVDLEGNPRVVEGYVDMGSYEYQVILGLADSDGDGLPDEWEQEYFGGNADPERDDDGDLFCNGDEQVAGTDPTDEDSFFRITDWSTSESFMIEWWPCATGRHYSVWWSTNLPAGFQPLVLNLDYPQHSYTDVVHSAWPQIFFKAEVSLESEVPSVPENMVLIPAGTNAVNDGIYSAYVLRVEQPFYMDAYEVSGAQWSAVYDWAISHGYDFSTHGVWAASDHPVVWINWYDCAKWCNARSQMEGRSPCYFISGHLFRTGQVDHVETDYEANGFRLPSQAEWEYATRGGFGSYLYPWGNAITTNDANYALSGTTACGSYPANAFGLYDMVGNVWEWCDNITVAGGPGIAEERGRDSGGFGHADPLYMRCGIHAALPSQGYTDNAWKSLGFRTICR